MVAVVRKKLLGGARLWKTCSTSELSVVGACRDLDQASRSTHREKKYRSTSAIRILGMSRAPGPITCQPGMGLSEVRGAVFPSQQGGIPNLR